MEDGYTDKAEAVLWMRPFEKSDSSHLLEWRNHPNVRMFSRSTELIEPAEHEKWFEERLRNIQNLGQIYFFGHQTKRLGMVRLDLLPNNSAEISILVNPASHGLGIGKAILAMVISEAFEVLQLTKLVAVIHHDNIASGRLFERFNFVCISSSLSFSTFELRSGI